MIFDKYLYNEYKYIYNEVFQSQSDPIAKQFESNKHIINCD